MENKKLIIVPIIAFGIAMILNCHLDRIDPPCPTVDSLSPTAAQFGQIVSIKGDNFQTGLPQLYTVKIGDITLSANDSIDVPDVNTLRFKVPKGISSGPVRISLSGSFNCNTIQPYFTYYYTATMVTKFIGELNSPSGLNLDFAENVVVADRFKNLIKVIKPNADPSVVGELIKTHGNGTAGCNNNTIFDSKDASFRSPSDISIDSEGNIYITEESSNAVIRRIKPDKLVEVFAGSCGMSGIFPGARLGGAKLNLPLSVATDGSELYFTDAGNIRKIDALGNVTLLTAKPANSYFRGIEISRSRSGVGPIFVTDEIGNTIKSVDLGGAARNIDFAPNLFGDPVALSLDSKGNIFVVDKGKHQVFVIYTNAILSVLAGVGEAGYSEGLPGKMAKFDQPSGIILNERTGIVYVSDSNNGVVRSIKIE